MYSSLKEKLRYIEMRTYVETRFPGIVFRMYEPRLPFIIASP